MRSKVNNMNQIVRNLRKDILNISYKGQVGHIGSALSIIDILSVLYFKILKINPADPKNEDRDRFLLSKGHAASALYTVLCRKDFFSETELFTFCQNGGRLSVHPENTSLPGIEYASGSLGHGLAVAGGLALAAKKKHKQNRVFVLMSDAECNEGSIWEAAMFAAQQKLDNLVVIVDYNKMQAMGRTGDIIQLEPFVDKWKAFGWGTLEIDGHNLSELEEKLTHLPIKKGKPNAIIAHTVLGKGISFMEDRLNWHYLTMTEEHFKNAMKELELQEKS